jgi:hypothetical protein
METGAVRGPKCRVARTLGGARAVPRFRRELQSLRLGRGGPVPAYPRGRVHNPVRAWCHLLACGRYPRSRPAPGPIRTWKDRELSQANAAARDRARMAHLSRRAAPARSVAGSRADQGNSSPNPTPPYVILLTARASLPRVGLPAVESCSGWPWNCPSADRLHPHSSPSPNSSGGLHGR